MFKRELKVNLKSLIIWTSITIFMFLIVFLVYPSIMSSDNANALNEMMKVFPEEILKMFNMDLSGLESVFAWYKSEGLLFLMILGGLYSSILGITIISKEEENHTIEFLLSKPISRNQVITSKLLCGFLYITIMFIILTLFNLIGMILSNDLELKRFLLLSLTPLFTMYSIFSLSTLISVIVKKPKKMYSYAIALTMGSYFLQVVGNLSSKVKFIKYLSVFELTPTRSIIQNNTFNIIYPLISIIIVIISISLTYIIYNKKELG